MLRISPAPVIKVVNCSPAPGHTSRKTTQGLLLAFPPHSKSESVTVFVRIHYRNIPPGDQIRLAAEEG